MNLDNVNDDKHRYNNCIILCCACGIQFAWMYHCLLEPLDVISKEMAHLDPTDILSKEYPLDSIYWFLSTTALGHGVFLYIKNPSWQHQLHCYAHWIQGSCLSYVIILLCGINPFKTSFDTTMASSIYITTLLLGITASNLPYESWSMLPRMRSLLEGSDDVIASMSLYGVFCGAIPFQLLQVLDWGKQIQRWPLPLILGTTTGWVMGTLVGLILMIYSKPKTLFIEINQDNNKKPW
jgi:GPI biosynthesis protein family Pig-F